MKRRYTESSEETTALVGLQISQIMDMVVRCKTSKSQKQAEKMLKGLPFVFFIHRSMKLVLLIVFLIATEYFLWLVLML